MRDLLGPYMDRALGTSLLIWVYTEANSFLIPLTQNALLWLTPRSLCLLFFAVINFARAHKCFANGYENENYAMQFWPW